MEENRMTIREVLETTERTLKGVSLPVEMIGTAQVIMNCAGNLRACIDAIDKADAEAEEKAEGGETDGSDPDLE